MATDEIFNYFIERHIAIKEDWLEQASKFVSEKYKKRVTPDVIYEQFLYSDLSKSCYPILSQIGIDKNTPKVLVNQPFVVQIVSIVDIGTPFHTQYHKLTYEFVDNSGFEALPEKEDLNPWEAKPRRMLMMQIGDGSDTIKAIELWAIPQLSLLTKPGCKLLLKPPLTCRRGILMLKGNNCQILGGDVLEFFDTGRPVQVMLKALSIVPKKPKASTSTAGSVAEVVEPVDNMEDDYYDEAERYDDEMRELNMSLVAEGGVLDEGDFDNRPDSNAVYARDDDIDRNPVIEESDGDTMDCPQYRNRMPEPRQETSIREAFLREPPSFPTSSTPVVERRTSHERSGVLSTSSRPRRDDHITLEDSPPSFSPNRPPKRKSSILSSPTSSAENSRILFDPRRRPGADPPPVKVVSPLFDPRRVRNPGIQSFLKRTDRISPPPRKRLSSSTMPTTSIKMEVIDLSDDEEDIKPDVSRLSNISMNKTIPFEVVAPVVVVPKHPIDYFSLPLVNNQFIEKLRVLSTVSLSDAKRRSNYITGSARYNVQAIVQDITLPLRVVDGMWSQTVKLADESDTLLCLIDNPTLTSLIGLSPAEANAIKQSNDIDRRSDGARRLKAVSTQMQRLDLLFEVEMFSNGIVDPVVRSIKTMPQALDAF